MSATAAHSDSPDSLSEAKRRRLLYRASHRGIKEMDLLLGGFARESVFSLDEAQLERFAELLEEADHDLLDWFTGLRPPPERLRGPLFDAIASRRIAVES